MARNHASCAVLAAAIFGLLGASEAAAAAYTDIDDMDLRSGRFIQERMPALAPMGYVIFCMRQPGECTYGGARAALLTGDAKAELEIVNREVNQSTRGVPDAKAPGGDVWRIADGSGDCEDFALAKRSLLIKRGWSPGALRIAVAVTPSGEGHAVLVVRTTDGDLVLDSRHNRIVNWRSTDLHWVKIQMSDNAMTWASI